MSRRQQGASIWMMLLMVVVLGFAAIFGLKLIPIYLESYKIDKAIAGALQGDVGSQNKTEIMRAIVRRLDIDEVRRIHERNFFEYGTIIKKGNNVTVNLVYDVEASLIGNLSVIAHFDKTFTN